MTADDPFRHHPGLRGKITPVDQSFFRDFTLDKMKATLAAEGLPIFSHYSDEEREELRASTLAARPDGPLWVFAYGSLMWDPALEFAEVRRARLPGYARRFILVDTLGGRGTPDQPGAMAALDDGDHCSGLAFRIDEDIVDRETEILWRRECIRPAYLPVFLPAETDHGSIMTLALIADHSSDMIEPELSREAQIEHLATGTGFLGSSVDYLRGIVERFRILGIEDQDAEALLSAVEARILALAATSGTTPAE